MLHDDFGDRGSLGVGEQFGNHGTSYNRNVIMLQRWSNSDHFGITFGVNQAGVSIAGVATDTAALQMVVFVEHDRGWRMGRVQTFGL